MLYNGVLHTCYEVFVHICHFDFIIAKVTKNKPSYVHLSQNIAAIKIFYQLAILFFTYFLYFCNDLYVNFNKHNPKLENGKRKQTFTAIRGNAMEAVL